MAGYGTVFVPDHDLLRTRIGFGSSFTWHFTDRVGIRFYSTRRTSVTLIPAVGQFHFESRQERDDSGRVRGSIEDIIGLHLRLQIAALPLDSAPLGLTLEVLGASAIPTGDLIEDVYAPFEV